jgi:NAD(P)-dependent dehydrogenase (short-subunit alcohol dehydrogenase family)
MPWSIDDIPDQTGKVAVVTGANGGLGLATALALADKGAHVVMASRNQDKAAQARAFLLARVPDASIEDVPLDLGDLASVRAAAERILASHDRIDILVNNAGLMAMPERRTADGFEMQFGVNHLGHWALTGLLLPAIVEADAARVVSVSSTAHHMGRIVNPNNPHLDGTYGPWKAYGQSKLANLHFAVGLQRQFEEADSSARSLAAHPGLANSDLQARSVRENESFWTKFFHGATTSMGMSPKYGALSQLRAATDPDAPGGSFWGPLWVNAGPPVRKPLLRRIDLNAGIRRLWDVSERETGVAMDVAGALAAAR